jgi:hypothetical protein
LSFPEAIDGVAMSTSPAAGHPRKSIVPKYRPKEPDVISTPKQSWRRNSPTSLMRTPPRFTSEVNRQQYRQGIRTLALVYAGILALVVAITALCGEWRNQEVAAQTTAGAVDIPRR